MEFFIFLIFFVFVFIVVLPKSTQGGQRAAGRKGQRPKPSAQKDTQRQYSHNRPPRPRQRQKAQVKYKRSAGDNNRHRRDDWGARGRSGTHDLVLLLVLFAGVVVSLYALTLVL